jgi:hypothetical protein
MVNLSHHVIMSVGLMCLMVGTVWATPCSESTDRRSCLVEELKDLQAQVKYVEAELNTLAPTKSLSSDLWLSLDLGIDVISGLYTSVGISVPIGPLTFSPGVWFGSTYDNLKASPERGWYLTVGYSWTLWE